MFPNNDLTPDSISTWKLVKIHFLFADNKDYRVCINLQRQKVFSCIRQLIRVRPWSGVSEQKKASYPFIWRWAYFVFLNRKKLSHETPFPVMRFTCFGFDNFYLFNPKQWKSQ